MRWSFVLAIAANWVNLIAQCVSTPRGGMDRLAEPFVVGLKTRDCYSPVLGDVAETEITVFGF